MRVIHRISTLLASLTLVACTQLAPATPWVGPTVAVTSRITPFSTAVIPCDTVFRRHPLTHTTLLPTPVQLFTSNGAGIAAGDVNGDGLNDLVLANIAGDTTLALNHGNFTFEEFLLHLPYTRAIAIVDVDGDGHLDITTTHRGAGMSMLHNMGTNPPQFRRIPITLDQSRTYSMLWHDFNGDDRLDVVTGSYDADVQRGGGLSLFDHQNSGVFVHTQNANGTFTSRRLSDRANALTITALDIDSDGHDDIVVGNDFDMRDQVWLARGSDWQATQPFDSTPHSTMSYDIGDINRDGQPDLYAADMNPYNTDVATMAAWLPVTSNMPQLHPNDDPQLMENALLQRTTSGRWQSYGRELAADATGWSWSTRLGDLDNDGYTDIYSVNGMIAQELFPYLPNYELVEQNQALRFDGTRFVPTPTWGLADTASGRGMVMSDLNNDGKLDIAINNMQSASVVYENRTCNGRALAVTLRQSGTNPYAIGAQLRLISANHTQWEQIAVTRGYLSGNAPIAHFGIGTDSPTTLEIRWPDGALSTITTPDTQQLLTITRSTP